MTPYQEAKNALYPYVMNGIKLAIGSYVVAYTVVAYNAVQEKLFTEVATEPEPAEEQPPAKVKKAA